MGDPSRVRVADAGNAVSFGSLQAFGDAIGTGLGVDYVARRAGTPGTNGWETHAVTPPQQPFGTLGALVAGWPEYVGDFSADLSKGIFRSLSAVTNAPNVESVKNLYVRNDLLAAGGGSYSLTTDSVAVTPPAGTGVNGPGYRPRLAGTSTDFSHVLFESQLNLTVDASGDQVKLYEWVNGATRLVGVLPNGTLATVGCDTDAPCAVAGQGATVTNYTDRTLSADGSRAFFASPVSSFGNTTPSSNLYMRDDHTTDSLVDDTTVQINASERTSPATPSGATFGTASKDGTRVFFTTDEPLTNDAVSSGTNLYMYDASKPDAAPDNLTLISVDNEPADGAGVEGVIGASDDGTYVYFVATQQLVSGAPMAQGDKLYVWHEGTGVRYIGMLTEGDDATLAMGSAGYLLRPKTARVASDGTAMVFTATSGDGLGGYDHGSGCGVGGAFSCSEVYVYNATANGGAGHLACASCNPSGAAATTDASTYVENGLSAGTRNSHLNQALSDDGKRVFFTTGDRLVSGDQNTARDVYEYDTDTSALHLISSGHDPSDSYFMAASPSGDDVFFITRERFVGWDRDGGYDLYDARTPHPDAGFAEPPLAAVDCDGSACQGSLTGPPSGPSFGSSLLTTSTGNAVPVSKKTSKPLSKAQKLRKALKACKSKHGKAKRKKCESAARKRFGKSGGSNNVVSS
jgi:hypothetical protein